MLGGDIRVREGGGWVGGYQGSVAVVVDTMDGRGIGGRSSSLEKTYKG